MNSNKLRRKLMLRRSMGMSSPKMLIRTQMPWWLRLLLVFIGLALAAMVGVALYEHGASLSGFNKDGLRKEVEQLRAENKTLTEDKERLTRASISSESGLVIEKATTKQIIEQSKQLEAENAKLKEDLRFFESLLPATGGSDAISVRNLRGQLDVANHQLLVRLLVMQGGKHVSNFVGNLQISAVGMVDGKPMTWTYPLANNLAVADAKLNFSRYQRVELNIPLGTMSLQKAILKSLQVRVLSGGAIKAQAIGAVSENIQSLESAVSP